MLAFEALQVFTQMGLPPGLRCCPGAELPGWIMPYMLMMATFKLGYPVSVFIKQVASNRAKHCRGVSHENYCIAGVIPAWPP